ncbi:capsule biosynthesis protein CapA-like [Oculina patagonica]
MYKGKKSVLLEASPKAAPALSFAGFDAVTVANNHLNDFGSEGANYTVEVLKKTGIQYFGVTYGKYDTSQEPLILEKNGIRIGFLAYCDTLSKNENCTEMRMLFNSGPAIYRDDIATRDVNKLKKDNVDIVVVFLHYGQERALRPLPYQHHTNKHLMSLGVEIIIGAHPHVLQPHCIMDNKLIAYSLGNFLFYPNRPLGGNNPKVYGGFGMKSNKLLIESYEHFVLGNCDSLKASQMLKVTVSRRNGILEAKYLPVKIAFDHKTKRIHPESNKNAKWITVCGVEDKQCQECHKS